METALSIALWGGLLFLMMRFGCGSHMFGHRHGHGQEGDGNDTAGKGAGCCGGDSKKKVATPPKHEALRWEAPESDTDPVCGKTVSPDTAKTSIHDGLVYYFCSPECRNIFETNPNPYLTEKQTAE